MKTLTFLFLTLVTVFTLHYSTSWPKWMAIQYLGALTIGYVISLRYSALPAAFVIWILGSGLNIFADQATIGGVPGSQILAVENIALKATVAFLLVVIPIAFVPRKIHDHIEDWLGMICLVDSIIVIVQYFGNIPGPSRGGFLGNPSINGCFIACTYPFLCFKDEIIPYVKKPISLFFRNEWLSFFFDFLCVALPIIAVFLSSASIPVGAMAVVWLVYIGSQKIGPFIAPILAVLISGSIIGAGVYFTPDFLFSSGRLAIWQASLKWFYLYAPHWIGVGNGEFFLVGGVIQQMFHVGEGNWFAWAHNDWLQTLIEDGYIGLGLAVALFIFALIICIRKKQNYLLAAVACYGSVSFFNFPAHCAPFALLGTFLVAKIYSREEQN